MADLVTDIAIIGMAGRLPGARDVAEFWRNLVNGTESITHFSSAELEVANAKALAERSDYVRARAIITDADQFDAAFFGIHPKEAELIDPQQRIFLECCWHAFEDAGYDPLNHQGLTAVFAGCSFNSYFARSTMAGATAVADYTEGYQVSNFNATLASNFEFLPTRVAYKLNLRGPAFSLNCGCSTSLVAVAQACLHLQNYQCDMALAGGVSITFPQRRGYLHEPGGIVSPDGHCRAFDEAAAGTVFGDGAAVVLLKRLDEALAAGDHIYAVIKGFGLANDGAAKVGFTAPGVEGQARAIAMAHSAADVDPASISYVEAHGTGTALGDPIEIAALTQAFRRSTDARQFCALGTAKTNVGHLDVAAGVTGLIKTALSLHHETLPAVLHFERPNPKLNLEESPFYINARLAPWKRSDAPRRAGVSAFGIGGTNAHLVLEEAPADRPHHQSSGMQLLVVSAKTESALAVARENLAAFLTAHPEVTLADVAHTLMVGRHPFGVRTAIVARDSAEAAVLLRSSEQNSAHSVARSDDPSVAFMFPGQGSQHPGMGRSIYETQPVFREEVDRCIATLAKLGETDVARVFRCPAEEVELSSDELSATSIAQPAIFVIEYALARMWMSMGIMPSAMIGHSVGEFVAARLAGVFSFEDALRLVTERGKLMQSMPAGAMLSVRLGQDKARQYLNDAISLAAINGPSLSVLAGPEHEVVKLEQRLSADQVVFRRLRTSHAFHSSMMEPAVARFAKLMSGVALAPPAIPIISSTTGEQLSAEQATSPDYWARHLREPVRFSDGAKQLRAKYDVLLEVGPGTTLVQLARQHPAAAEQLVVASLPDQSGESSGDASILTALGQMWMRGAKPSWSELHRSGVPKRVSLPAYPFERKRFWAEYRFDKAMTKLESPSDTHSNYDVSSEGIEKSPMISPMEIKPTTTRRDRIVASLQEIFADLSGLDMTTIDQAAPFLELGFDSLFLTQVSQALQAKFGIKITFRQLLDKLSNIEAVSDHLNTALPPEAIPEPVQESATLEAPQQIQVATAGDGTSGQKPAVSIEGSDLEGLFRAQLQTLTELMNKQLDVLRATSAGGGRVASAPKAAGAMNGIAKARVAEQPKPIAPTVVSPATLPQSRKFVPFRAVEAGSGSDFTAHQKQYLAEFIQRYNRKTSGSKEATQAYRRYLADPRAASGFRVEWKELIYPIVTVRSKGSKLWDVDGNEYVDMVNGFGPILFGHNTDFVNRAIEEQMKLGYETGPQSPLAGKVAKLIAEMTGTDRVTFCNTGSEAVVAALRVARTITGRNKIVIFAGAYHGMFDEVVVKGVPSASGPRSLPVAPGIPREMVANVTVLDYGTPEALAYIDSHANELAAVLVEPVQSRHPGLRPIDFLKRVRQITEQSGTALIFDEVVTGFRVHPGGCQALFGIKADLATYGKVLGGGLPVGILAGKAAFMDALDGGMWNYGDDSYPETGVTFYAGTFVRHPLALAAVWAVLNYLKDAGPQFYSRLEATTSGMVSELNRFLAERGLPLQVASFGSVACFTFPAEYKYASLFYYLMRERNVFVQEGFPLFVTSSHSEADIAVVVRAFKESISELQATGFLPASAERLPLPATGVAIATTIANHNGAVHSLNGHHKVEAPPRRARLTEAQLEILLSARLSPQASCCYNESFTLKLKGDLNEAALLKAIDLMLERHEALRATFSSDGEHQEFAHELKLKVERKDLSRADKPAQARQLRAIIADDAREPFDLNQGPLVRAKLIRTASDEHHLIFTSHHIVCDGWSTNVLLDDLSKLYTGLAGGAEVDPAPAMLFSEYADAQAEHFAGQASRVDEVYWTGVFAQLPPPLDLPLDHQRSSVRTYSGATIRKIIPPDLTHRIKVAGASRNCTLFVTLLSALTVLLSRLSGQDDVVVGIPSAGQSLLDDERVLVGHCVNFLPIRAVVNSDAPLSAHLKSVKQAVLDAYDHQNYTYGRLIRNLPIVRDPSRLPLTEVQFNLEKVGGDLKFNRLEVEVDPNPKSFVNQDLFLNIIESEQGLVLDCDFNTDLFDETTVQRWLDHYSVMLEAMTHDLDRSTGTMPLLNEAARRQLLVEWNETRAEYPRDRLVHELFEAQVARTPDAIAVVFGQEQIKYSEVDARAERLAAYLRTNGVAPGSLVAICVPRTPNMVVALLGVLKADCTYVPLDPFYPEERLRFILEETQAAMVITESTVASAVSSWQGQKVELDRELPVAAISTRSSTKLTPEDPAYVIYTSGSTGKPKGVKVAHRAYVNLLSSMAAKPGFSAQDSLLAVTTMAFDIAGLELMLPLVTGGRLIIATRECAAVGSALLEEIRRTGANVMQATPITWRLLLDEGWSGEPRLKMLCGGEALPEDLARRLIATGGELWNMYGPTETTIWSATIRLKGEDPVTLGGPIANTQFYVLDPFQQPSPLGVPGELYISGDGVANGYFKRSELTDQKFVADGFASDPKQRMFRTGDLVRRLPDGSLRFLGRLDNQIKLRGYRIELGEIETLLAASPGVKDCAVSVANDADGEPRLVAYVAGLEGQTPDTSELKNQLRKQLPEYMVPASFVGLASLPRTKNGKLDRKALLPAPSSERDSLASSFVGPRNSLEETLCSIWAQVLGVSQVGIESDIFALGADSVHIFKIASRANRAGVPVEPLQIFEQRTIAAIASQLAVHGAVQKSAEAKSQLP